MSNTKRKLELYPGKVGGVTLYPGSIGNKYPLYPGYVELDMPTVPNPNSAYPIWWDTTITIYNRYMDNQTHVMSWFRTVIDDCFWKLSGTEIQLGDSTLDGKTTLCRIPKDSRFLDKDEWLKIPNDQMGNYFTIGQGDIVVRGNCDFIINEYQEGKHSTDLLDKYRAYQQCMEITDYTNDTGIGRNSEHYLIRGK